MIHPNEVTFIIPIYKLGTDRLNNLRFILPYIIKIGARVLVVEQVKESSTLLNLKEFAIEHLLYVSTSEKFHKTGIINWAVKNHVTTKYVWVNDVDFYMKFSKVFEVDWTEDFIQPYSTGKKLSSDDSTKILRGEKVNVSYEDAEAEYISLYGALSFIFKRESFLNIGGMDESLFGWGREDVELNQRISSQCVIQKFEFKGIHLWHLVGPVPKHEEDDLAVMCCHFNWCGYTNPVRNLNRFLDYMDSIGVAVYGIELSLTGQFVTRERQNWKHVTVKAENVCFQKEACINLVEKMVPLKYTKLAWIDTDLFFTNSNWYEEASEKLNSYKLVQLYSDGADTDRTGRVISVTDGIMFAGGPKNERGYFGHPGGAWAARREFWRYGGLYSKSFMGSGDTILINTICHVGMQVPTSELKSDYYLAWKKNMCSYIAKSDVSYISGRFIHEWHGDKDKRGYIERNALIEKVDFSKHVALDENGLIKIEGATQGFYSDVMSYFYSRNEDGIRTTNDIQIQDMAVLTVHFNWHGFSTPEKNLRRFILEMESNNIPLFGIELSLTGKFVTEKYPNWVKVRVNKENICFQKEACINLLEKTIPERYKKIAWIDHDIFFMNRNWYNEASNKLNSYKVIQLYSKEIFLDKNGKECSSIPSLMSAGGPNVETTNRKYSGNPGAALAARRDLWRIGSGLFPFSFLGGGDSVMLYTIYNNQQDAQINRACGLSKKFKPYIQWSEITRKYVDESCSWIDGEIVHSWHGDKVDRQYSTRHNISDNINWEKSVTLNKYELIELKSLPENVHGEIYYYFKNRQEDGEI